MFLFLSQSFFLPLQSRQSWLNTCKKLHCDLSTSATWRWSISDWVHTGTSYTWTCQRMDQSQRHSSYWPTVYHWQSHSRYRVRVSCRCCEQERDERLQSNVTKDNDSNSTATSGLYFTNLESRSRWTDSHKKWHGCRSRWHNQSVQFWSK